MLYVYLLRFMMYCCVGKVAAALQQIDMTDNETFHTKSFNSGAGTKSIVLQNQNGPCALVAIVNVLALKDTPMAACVNAHQDYIDEETLKLKLGEIATSMDVDSEKMNSLFEFMPRLSQGLDVNPKFDGTFAPSPELRLFEAFGIPLVHTWVLGDNERAELGIQDEKLAKLSYEEACALQFSETPDPGLGLFMELYASQMTISGVNSLMDAIMDDSLAVMFWNNHFSTIIKHDGGLYSLVTDLGFLRKEEIVWERIDARGAGDFVNGKFRPADEQEKADEALAHHLAESGDKAKHAQETPANKTVAKKNKSRCSIS